MQGFQQQYLDELRAILGDDIDRFLRAMTDEPIRSLRLNPLRAPSAAQPFLRERVPWAQSGYYYDGRPGLSIAHAAGAYYMQEASAMTAAAILDARPGEVVLDLCAAPGGKSTQIAASMAGCGALVCNEPDPGRCRILAANLERMGVSNAIAVCAYPEQLAKRWRETFDAILVDAPCSGEGMFRKHPEARDEWNTCSPSGCAQRQSGILDAAAEMLKPGGRMVYSTCTFNRMENEYGIKAFLERHPEFHAEDFALEGLGRSVNGMIRVWPHKVRGEGHFACRLRKQGGAAIDDDAMRERSASGGGDNIPAEMHAAGTAINQDTSGGEDNDISVAMRDTGEAIGQSASIRKNGALGAEDINTSAAIHAAGMAINQMASRAKDDTNHKIDARAARRDQSAKGRKQARGSKAREDGDDALRDMLSTLAREVCDADDLLRGKRLFMQGEYLYAVPQTIPDSDGLKLALSGLCLLRVGKGYIEPAHALAMAIDPEKCRNRLPLDDEQAEAYERGEALQTDAAVKGWALAMWQGLPLGWTKVSGGTAKNHLPKGLRDGNRI